MGIKKTKTVEGCVQLGGIISSYHGDKLLSTMFVEFQVYYIIALLSSCGILLLHESSSESQSIPQLSFLDDVKSET